MVRFLRWLSQGRGFQLQLLQILLLFALWRFWRKICLFCSLTQHPELQFEKPRLKKMFSLIRYKSFLFTSETLICQNIVNNIIKAMLTTTTKEKSSVQWNKGTLQGSSASSSCNCVMLKLNPVNNPAGSLCAGDRWVWNWFLRFRAAISLNGCHSQGTASPATQHNRTSIEWVGI